MPTLFSKPKHLVEPGVYRIKSAARNPAKYLEYKDDHEIRPADDRSGSNAQKWRISVGSDNTYKITNVGSGKDLKISEYQEDGQTKFRPYGDTPDEIWWTIEPRGEAWVIGFSGDHRCLDYADHATQEYVFLWERNGLSHQRWYLEKA